MGSRRRRGRLGLLGLSCASLTLGAHAAPWVPDAGSGSTRLMLRHYDATRAFLPGQYGTSSQPGSEQRYSQLRVTGRHGLGHGLALEYDLRGARAEKIRTRHAKITRSSATGVEDQEVGLNLALTQRPEFADSVSLNLVVATGSATTVPALGVGHNALEPDFQAGWAGARWRVSAQAGARVFFDSGVTQMRADLDLGLRLAPRWQLGASLFYVRTVGGRSPLPPTDSGERYDLLRPGIRLEYRATPQLRPYVEYEQDLAGQGQHAGRRFTLGLSHAY
ncbi:MAG: transporter [Burkholderiales bacterium]|nr:transporter [Burkholderiales bacterium]MDE2453473.1 transporter [Burkholderiales bacterium]